MENEQAEGLGSLLLLLLAILAITFFLNIEDQPDSGAPPQPLQGEWVHQQEAPAPVLSSATKPIAKKRRVL